jgi:hypothetical protein
VTHADVEVGPKPASRACRVDGAADWIDKRHVSTTETLASSPSVNALASLADSWQAVHSFSRVRARHFLDHLTRRDGRPHSIGGRGCMAQYVTGALASRADWAVC